MSYIKREDAKHAIMAYIGEQTVSKYATAEECRAARHGAEGAFNELDYLPTVDVVEVRHGEWGFDGLGYTCSECGEYALAIKTRMQVRSNYCPRCGAKMDGERSTKDAT